MSIRKHTRAGAKKSARRSLSTKHLQQLLSISKDNPKLQDLHDVVTIVSNTGIRIGNLCRLRWTDVDFQKNQLRIDCIPPQYVPFGPRTGQILIARREREPQSDYVLGKSPSTVRHRVSNQLRKVCSEIGANNIQLYHVRHTFFKRMIDAGCNIHSLMKIGGYRSSYSPIKCFVDGNRLIEIAIPYLSQLEQY